MAMTFNLENSYYWYSLKKLRDTSTWTVRSALILKAARAIVERSYDHWEFGQDMQAEWDERGLDNADVETVLDVIDTIMGHLRDISRMIMPVDDDNEYYIATRQSIKAAERYTKELEPIAAKEGIVALNKAEQKLFRDARDWVTLFCEAG